MFNSLVKNISNIFGNKSDRDVKSVRPLVDAINVHFESYNKLSLDELRGKTIEFKQRIADFLGEIDSEIESLKSKIDLLDIDAISEKEEYFARIDELEKERDEELEKILHQLLPEAFAVVKQTAKRFSENTQLRVKATDYDRELAVRLPHVNMDGNDAIYNNSWEAAGSTITWNMVHYDVQLIGGIVLHEGKISEMATGEGKTLVSTLPAYLNALGGRGVHIVTVNDYLARRDSEWNAPIFQFHGLKVDCIEYHKPHSEGRKKAYQADIIYGTNNEFGFDYLRDNMAHSPDELVQGKLHYAMVDEVDSVLVDDARTPLIISGPVPKGDQHEFHDLKPRIEKLVDVQKKYTTQALLEAKRLITEGKEKEAGFLLLRAHRGLPKNKALIKFLGEGGMKALLQKTENHYMQDQNKEMHKVDAELYFTIDEKINQVELTEKGIELITKGDEDKNFFIMPDVGTSIAELEKAYLSDEEKAARKEALMLDFSTKSERIHSVNQLLKAYTMFERDVEYIIQENKVKIVDEQTGRVMDGRRYSDGLHQAIEAKENVKVEDATQTFATITLQNFFRMYHKLSGMTGTAETEAGELWEIYKLDVVVIPTNRPIIRKDTEDVVYKTKREKYNAVIDEIQRMQEMGRPVLVGTTSVEVSETLSRMLQLRKLKHNVLNAKQHQREADIVAEAGFAGSVTIATNMAGRGTDIKLGAGVKENGGLAIIGTERHESRRVDRQLRGRAGRQGDPGSSQFFVSLEDDLMRLFGSDRVASVMDKMGHTEGDMIQHSLISKTIERSQKKVEQNNFGIRKRLLEYDDVMNKQRVVIYTRRKNALFGDRLSADISNAVYDWCEITSAEYKENHDYDGFVLECIRHLAYEPEISEETFLNTKGEALTQILFEELMSYYGKKSKHLAENALPVFRNIREEKGDRVENIIVPFSDGVKAIQVVVNLNKALKTNGAEIINSFERFVALAMIDDQWKEHLRELDDLKQAANNASYEQKDPLLIYKLESFNLFSSMIAKLNTELLSMLFRGHIHTPENNNLEEARTPKKSDTSKLKTSRVDDTAPSNAGREDTREVQKAPILSEKTIGRNDACPCGSGKKYKKCHGQEA
jgi:preprotein translocase subunit SecA